MALFRCGSGSGTPANITTFVNKNPTTQSPLVYTCLSDSDVIFSFGCSNTGSFSPSVTTSGSGTVTAIKTVSSGNNMGIYKIEGVSAGDTITFTQGQISSLVMSGVFAEYSDIHTM